MLELKRAFVMDQLRSSEVKGAPNNQEGYDPPRVILEDCTQSCRSPKAHRCDGRLEAARAL